MLEYLPCNFRQKCGCFVINAATRRIHDHKRDEAVTGCEQLSPVVALGRRKTSLSYWYISHPSGQICEVRILCMDGLEYSCYGEVQGVGIVHLEDYILPDETEG